MLGRTVLHNNGRITVDSRWIVPHSLFLAAKYNAHITVEICAQFTYVKYLYKYVCKGHNRAQLHVGDSNEQQNDIKNIPGATSFEKYFKAK